MIFSCHYRILPPLSPGDGKGGEGAWHRRRRRPRCRPAWAGDATGAAGVDHYDFLYCVRQGRGKVWHVKGLAENVTRLGY